MLGRRIRTLPITFIATFAAACAGHDGARAVPVLDPAARRAEAMLNAADTALAHGDELMARRALETASLEPPTSPSVTFRLARLADRLDDPGTAARSYRRYLSLVAYGPVADSARRHLATLVASGPVTTSISAGELARDTTLSDPPVRKKKASARHHARRRHRRR